MTSPRHQEVVEVVKQAVIELKALYFLSQIEKDLIKQFDKILKATPPMSIENILYVCRDAIAVVNVEQGNFKPGKFRKRVAELMTDIQRGASVTEEYNPADMKAGDVKSVNKAKTKKEATETKQTTSLTSLTDELQINVSKFLNAQEAATLGLVSRGANQLFNHPRANYIWLQRFSERFPWLIAGFSDQKMLDETKLDAYLTLDKSKAQHQEAPWRARYRAAIRKDAADENEAAEQLTEETREKYLSKSQIHQFSVLFPPLPASLLSLPAEDSIKAFYKSLVQAMEWSPADESLNNLKDLLRKFLWATTNNDFIQLQKNNMAIIDITNQKSFLQDRLILLATSFGQLEVVIHLHRKHQFPITNHIVAEALMMGRIDIVHYLQLLAPRTKCVEEMDFLRARYALRNDKTIVVNLLSDPRVLLEMKNDINVRFELFENIIMRRSLALLKRVVTLLNQSLPQEDILRLFIREMTKPQPAIACMHWLYTHSPEPFDAVDLVSHYLEYQKQPDLLMVKYLVSLGTKEQIKKAAAEVSLAILKCSDERRPLPKEILDFLNDKFFSPPVRPPSPGSST